MCLPRFAYAAKDQVENQARIEHLYTRAAALEISIKELKSDIVPLRTERLNKCRDELLKACERNRANAHRSGHEVEQARHEFRAWFSLILHQRSFLMTQLHEAQQSLVENEERLEEVYQELRDIDRLPLNH